MACEVPVKIEQVEGGFLASNDDLGVAAMGETEAQAIEHFKTALQGLIDEYGQAQAGSRN